MRRKVLMSSTRSLELVEGSWRVLQASGKLEGSSRVLQAGKEGEKRTEPSACFHCTS